MRARNLIYVAIAVGVVLLAVVPGLTQNAELRGTVTLRNGTAYTGVIQTARLGVSPDVTDGVGMQLKNLGALSLLIGTQKILIPSSDIRGIQVAWEQTKDTNVGGWEIASIAVTKKDGSKVEGKPTWLLGCSFLRIDTDDQGTVTLAAFPTASKFDPGQLIESIEIEAPATAEKPPAAEKPKPAEAPTPEVPAPTVAEQPAAEATVTPAEAPAATTPTATMLTITLTCPHCGKPITVTIPATVQ